MASRGGGRKQGARFDRARHEAKANALAWQREWENIPPIFKQNMAALTERLGFEALGAAIDSARLDHGTTPSWHKTPCE